ncbi:MAG TPA: cyclic nucleotide-binding domain-containing protein [Candidatus Dormibacteraeota bacterium]
MFRSRALASLVAGFAAVSLAEWAYLVALSVAFFKAGGPQAVGLLGLRFVFSAAGSIVGPSVVARHQALRVLAAVAVSRALIVGTTALLAGRGSDLAVLLLLVCIDGLAGSLYRPAQAAAIPALSRAPAEISAAAAAMSTAKTVSQAVGAVLGGLLLRAFSAPDIFAGAAAIFLLASIPALRLSSQSVLVGDPDATIGERLRSVSAAAREARVANLLAISGFRTFVRGMWTTIAVIAAFRLLHGDSTVLGLLMLASGVGAVLAVPVVASLIGRTSLSRPAAAALIGCGVPLALIAALPRLAAAMPLLVVWGVAMAIADATSSALLFRALPAQLLPRATSAIEAAKLVAEGAGALLVPLLVATVGIRGALLAAALPLPVLVLAGWQTLLRTDADGARFMRLLGLLHAVPLFARLDMERLGFLASRAERAESAPGVDVVTQGDRGDRFYVIEGGTAEVLIDGHAVDVLGRGDGFGERALLRDVPRMATVRARERLSTLGWTRQDFMLGVTGSSTSTDVPLQQRISRFAADPLSEYDRVRAVAQVGLLSRIDRDELTRLARDATVEHWDAGQRIVRNGDQGDRLYVLLAGRVRVTPSGSPPVTLIPGDYFGEIALLHDVPRTADVDAVDPAVTLGIDREAFVAAARSQLAAEPE